MTQSNPEAEAAAETPGFTLVTLCASPTLTVRATIVDRARFEAEGAELVTFDPLAGNVEKHEPFGTRFARKYGINALHIIPAQGDWYQHDDLFDCLATVAAHTKPGATLYGSSMGAYAATTHADRLPVAKVIALSPQYSIQRHLVPFEKRWGQHAARLSFRPDDADIAQGVHHYVFYDPRNPDAEHALMIGDRAARATLIEVPGGGHPVGPVLVQAGCLSTVILDIMRREPTREEIDAAVRPNLKRSALYHRVLGSQSPLSERGEWLRAGLELDPQDMKLQHAMGRWLHASGQPKEALPYLAFALRRRRRHPAFIEHYLSACADAGVEPDPELAAPLEAVAPRPGRRPQREPRAPRERRVRDRPQRAGATPPEAD